VDRFKALVIRRDEATKQQSVALETLGEDALMAGDVDVRVEYSTLNYKDGLAITGKLPVVRRFPMIPGVDLAGTVVRSARPEFREGDKVLLNGWGVGETHLGAYSQIARLSGDWLIPLPKTFTPAEAMAVGTAGYTAMLAIMALEMHGVGPGKGPAVVTGASGGVGSVAVALLAKLGYPVEAVTGRAAEGDYLRRLGARTVIDRAELSGPPRLLGKERWASGIDAVGGVVLANVLSMVAYGGAIAACGNAGSMDLTTSVAPFILRGVALLGIDSVRAPKMMRMAAWNRLAVDLDRGKLQSMIKTIGLNQVVDAAQDIVEGKVRGRVVVKID
jgi:acrylyl-CoA reductase (NADPH)